MPETFETPGPIDAEITIQYGSARLIAGDRTTTVVDVRPMSPGRGADVEAAQQTRVQFSGHRLEIRGPKARGLGMIFRPGAIEVVVQLPRGSRVHGSASYGDLDTQGSLGDCSFKTSYGTLKVEDAGAVTLVTSAGDITAGRVGGPAQLTTAAGEIRVAETAAPAILKTSSGDIRVEKAGDGLTARTAYGGIHVAEARGVVDLTTSYGDLEVGVARGTAAFLELRANHGRVRNDLERADAGPDSGETVKVTATTGYGDIRIRRA